MTHYTSWTSCSQAPLGPSLAESCSASAFVTFATILNSLLRSNPVISGMCDRVVPVEEPRDVYDFVVIGSGAGGSPVAARLTEVPNWSVLVLEAGQDEPAFGEVPLLHPNLLALDSLAWTYETVNENSACPSVTSSSHRQMGKMLGGSTAHNGMVYLRGVPTDYDNWAAQGNRGWSWNDVLPYFKKAEDNGEIERVGTKYHGTGGPLSVERFPYVHPIGSSILDAANEVSFGLSEDLNGDDITGFSRVQGTNKRGVRCSSAAAYLRPIRNRRNLHVSLNSTASRVIVENGVAVGVEYYKNGQRHMVRVTKEVIVSAGAFESPKLLMLSGIGPKEHLKSVGVDVVKDLPGVGGNLQDHALQVLQYTINDNDTYEYDRKVATQYLANLTGPLASNGLLQLNGRLPTSLTTFDYPDIQIQFSGYLPTCATGDSEALRSTGNRRLQIYVYLLHPKSRGTVTLASKNFLDPAVVWANYLNESTDVDRLIQGIGMVTNLADTEAMRAHNLTLPRPLEACSSHAPLSRDYWKCVICQTATNGAHPVGTCKMGPKSDPMAVVDDRLRVHGVKGLRVVDASIMPQVTSGNTGAPTIMIGEKAADFIKADHRTEVLRRTGRR